MRETYVVFRRELKSYFLSPIAYVFGVLFLALLLWFSVPKTLQHGLPASMQIFFGLLPVVFLAFLPGLTMRTWAEERKLGTLELLMTFPVTLPQLVFGKFAAALAYLGLVLLLTFALPIALAAHASVDWVPVLAAYVAALMLAGAYTALGMFWSSMTRDQIVAMLLALVSLLILWLLGNQNVIEDISPRLSDLSPEMARLVTAFLDLLAAISPYRYFESIARGVIDTRDVVYYACFCGFFLWLNALVLNARRKKG